MSIIFYFITKLLLLKVSPLQGNFQEQNDNEFKEGTFYFVYRSHAHKIISVSLSIIFLLPKRDG